MELKYNVAMATLIMYTVVLSALLVLLMNGYKTYCSEDSNKITVSDQISEVE